MIVVMTIHGIRWAFTFKEWSVEFGLEFKHFGIFFEGLVSIIVIWSQLIIILGHSCGILIPICFLWCVFISVMIILLFILILLHNTFLDLLLALPNYYLLVWLLLVIRIEHHEFGNILCAFSWLVCRFSNLIEELTVVHMGFTLWSHKWIIEIDSWTRCLTWIICLISYSILNSCLVTRLLFSNCRVISNSSLFFHQRILEISLVHFIQLIFCTQETISVGIQE